MLGIIPSVTKDNKEDYIKDIYDILPIVSAGHFHMQIKFTKHLTVSLFALQNYRYVNPLGMSDAYTHW